MTTADSPLGGRPAAPAPGPFREPLASRGPVTSREPEPPPASAPFAEKMAYYRSQHTTRGIRATHLVGIPGVAFSLPLLVGRPKVGLPMFVASWALQVAGHSVFEQNSPTLTKGFVTYQLCGLAFWCEEVADLLAGRGLGGQTRPPRRSRT
ncbi:conserved hypothetical protein [Parafrankia sp. Ea1.12]|nr:conserved hypothetical protein [Parafrankia sp. Ea1.12]